jgi:uncharacterized membrane protein YhiD involved in acid resistance
MDSMAALQSLLSAGRPGTFGLPDYLLCLLLAFVLAHLAAWAYIYTHSGLSYSKGFVQSIILLTIIICLGMMVIGHNIVIAFGLIGALAVIRFRNILKDTRDTAFVFFALVIGMACGTGSLDLAVTGTLFFCAVLLYLHWSSFGSRNASDGFIRFRIESRKPERETLQDVLSRHCNDLQLVSQRFAADGHSEIAYRLSMRDPIQAGKLVEDLQRLDGVSEITFALHEEQAEV